MSSGSSFTLELTENLLQIIRGTSKTLQLSVVSDVGAAVDITGARIIFTVKRTVSDQNPLIQKSTDNPAEALITSPKGGLAEIYLVPSDTHNLDSGIDYIYDVWVVQASGARFAVIPLSFFGVQDAVTRIPLS